MHTKHPFAHAPRAIARAGRVSLFAAVILLAGCGAGAGNGNGGNSISVSITNKATSIQAGTAAVLFSATVQNDATSSGVTWALAANGTTCSPSCGTLSQATSTTVMYTPPNSAPSVPNNQPTVTATSIAKTNKSDSDTFSITPALAVSITTKFSSVNTGASSFVLAATVQNDPTNSGVNWSLTANGAACTSACGTLSGETSTSVTYNPPPSVPANQPMLTATSVHDPSKSDNNSFTIQQLPIAITIEDKIASAFAGGSGIFFAANVQNDPSNNPAANWKLTVNGTNCQPACGTLSIAGSQSITYNPPPSVPTAPNNNPTLTAISVTDASKSDSNTFTILAAPPISVTVTRITSVLANASGGITFSANVQNDFSSPPKGVTWTLSAAGLACSPTCGSLSNKAAMSVIYTPPATVPLSPNDQPTLTATSVADPAKSGSDTFTITSTVTNGCSGAPTGSESLLNGQYALLMEGFEGSGTGTPILVAGSFNANGSGGINGGEEDINDTISPQHATFDSTAGNSLYTVGTDHRGCLQLTTTGGITSVFHFALGGINSGISSKGRVIEFDDNSGSGSGSRASGILRIQDPNSFVLTALQSQYAFGVGGWGMEDNQLVHFNAAGRFSSSGAANGVDDVDFGGITSPDTTGLQFSINPISPNTGWTTGSFDFFNWAIYMISPAEFFVISTDSIRSTVSLGKAIASGNSYTASSVSGNYVLHATGNNNGNADANLQSLTMTPGGAQTGTLSGTVYSYEAGSGAQTSTLSGVTYNVDAGSGRTTLGNPGDNLPILYLTTPTDGIAAFVAGVSADALFGIAEPQTSSALPAGTYIFGTEDPSDNTVPHRAGVETVATGGTLTGTYDQSATSGLQTGQSVNATISLGPGGVGNIGPSTVAITSGSKLFSIDETSGTSGPAAIVVAEQ
jgi:hypothetical protein